MSTKSEINISTIWDIFKVEIVPEAPGGKLVPKSRLGEVWKKGGNFFSHFSGGRGGSNWLFIPFIVGEKVCWPLFHLDIEKHAREIESCQKFMCRNTRFFVYNTSLKLVKNQAKAKQHPQAEISLFENYSHSSSMLSSKNSKCKLTISKFTSMFVSVRLYDLL